MRKLLLGLLGLLAAIALTAPAAAQADPNRLFQDSKVVVRDRFSDEIVGKGPDLVFIPGLSSFRGGGRGDGPHGRGDRCLPRRAETHARDAREVKGALHFIMLDQPPQAFEP
jgi:hypothetical protein